MIIGTYMAVFLYSKHRKNEIIPDRNLLKTNFILFVFFSVDKHCEITQKPPNDKKKLIIGIGSEKMTIEFLIPVVNSIMPENSIPVFSGKKYKNIFAKRLYIIIYPQTLNIESVLSDIASNKVPFLYDAISVEVFSLEA